MSDSVPSHLLKTDQFDQNGLLRALRAIGPVILLALPILAACHGAQSDNVWEWFVGSAAVMGLGFATWKLYLWLFRKNVWYFRRRRIRKRGLCPHCLGTLEGRRVCAQCGEELPPLCYAPGFTLTERCPHCRERLNPKRGVERCFAPGCSPAKPLEGFGDKAAVIAASVCCGTTDHTVRVLTERGYLRCGNRWHFSASDRSVLIRVVTDNEGLRGLAPAEHAKVEHLWLESGGDPAVFREALDFPRHQLPTVAFEDRSEQTCGLTEHAGCCRVTNGVTFRNFLDNLEGRST